MTAANKNKLVEVFAGTLWEAELVKGLLDSNAISCAIEDYSIGVVTSPYLPGGGDVIVVVNEADKEQAMKIIESR
ncbi:MAG: DUF2007 domain-containing protein [Bacteroidaceae bacterium]|nr:DUF2007 domain-containing protein [Bacteroidaceae bacterium]